MKITFVDEPEVLGDDSTSVSSDVPIQDTLPGSSEGDEGTVDAEETESILRSHEPGPLSVCLPMRLKKLIGRLARLLVVLIVVPNAPLGDNVSFFQLRIGMMPETNDLDKGTVKQRK